MIDIKVQFSVQVSGGPQVSLKRDIEVEAYNKIEIVIGPGDTDKVVNVAQGGQGQISFLLIRSNLYNSSDGVIEYKVGEGDNEKIIKLDQPQIFLGTGTVSLLGTDLSQVKFSNGYSPPGVDEPNKDKNKAEIEILVGRDATP